MYTEFKERVDSVIKNQSYKGIPTILVYLTTNEISKILKTMTPDCLLYPKTPITVFVDPENPTKIGSASCEPCPHAQRINGPKPEISCQIYFRNSK